ncbi:hypothetical protein [Sphingosinicella terrae]|uniref:hypothetical protein n=1 Tax=Sphingosinicella terrae TaxID=2172047 RepID=UPI000E0DE7BC|nr:hypothetical protein [Sphingosinicella terrae]
MSRRAILVTFLLLAGCARSEEASMVADPNSIEPVERVRTPEQDDQEVAIGAWRETLQDDQSALEFGPSGTPPLFSLRCDARRSVYVQRHGTITTGDLPMMLITVGSETRRLAVTTVGGTVPMLRASLAPSDTLIETLAGAETPITVRVGDTPPLVLPPSPSIPAFLGRCESGTTAPPEPANGNSAANEAAPAEAPANQVAPAAPAPR